MTRWPLAPLLELRARSEENAAAARESATSRLRRAERTVDDARRAAAHARIGAFSAPATIAELQARAHFGDRLESALHDAIALAASRRESVEQAQAAHVAARREHRAVAALHDRWRSRRRRAREAAQDDELEEIAAATWRRRSGHGPF